MRFWPVVLVVVLFAACLSTHDGGDTDDTVAVPDDDTAASADDDAADDNTGFDPPYSGTRYPIILVHGFAGWGYRGEWSNFFGVLDHLVANGYEVFEPDLPKIDAMDVRARELARVIDERYPGRRVNIIAHSQGGLDARYMISVLEWGDRVASLTMLSTPNRGTSLADIAARVLPGFAEEIIDLILNLFNMDWDGIYQLSHEYVEGVFNPAVPDDPGVAYFSFHGNGGELHLILWPTFVVLRAVEGCNDGVIGCDSTRWGRDMGELPVDHWGIVGMIAGHLAFDHLAFYRDWAANLRTMGY